MCVSSDNSIPSVRQEPTFRPWKGSSFLQQFGSKLMSLWVFYLQSFTFTAPWLPQIPLMVSQLPWAALILSQPSAQNQNPKWRFWKLLASNSNGAVLCGCGPQAAGPDPGWEAARCPPGSAEGHDPEGKRNHKLGYQGVILDGTWSGRFTCTRTGPNRRCPSAWTAEEKTALSGSEECPHLRRGRVPPAPRR